MEFFDCTRKTDYKEDSWAEGSVVYVFFFFWSVLRGATASIAALNVLVALFLSDLT